MAQTAGNIMNSTPTKEVHYGVCSDATGVCSSSYLKGSNLSDAFTGWYSIKMLPGGGGHAPQDAETAADPVTEKTMKKASGFGLTTLFVITALTGASAQAPAGVPVFQFDKAKSSIGFNVKASVAIAGKFDKWDATLTFTSPDISTGVLDIKAYANSVDTGSGMKDGKLKSKDFFDAEHNPYITFHSTKIVQTSPTSVDIPGTFTIRGVSKPETLTLDLVSGAVGTGHGEVKGIMAFDRKQYGMNSGIPFIKIADRVEVDVDLVATRVSGPPLVLNK
jgi:polyisoprenoid-binding protein YceI